MAFPARADPALEWGSTAICPLFTHFHHPCHPLSSHPSAHTLQGKPLKVRINLDQCLLSVTPDQHSSTTSIRPCERKLQIYLSRLEHSLLSPLTWLAYLNPLVFLMVLLFIFLLFTASHIPVVYLLTRSHEDFPLIFSVSSFGDNCLLLGNHCNAHWNPHVQYAFGRSQGIPRKC